MSQASVIIYRKSDKQRLCGFDKEVRTLTSFGVSIPITWNDIELWVHHRVIELVPVAEPLVVEIRGDYIFTLDAYMREYSLIINSTAVKITLAIQNVGFNFLLQKDDPITAYDRAMSIVGKR